MDYLKFFGLDTEPFQNDLDPRFYYESEPQKQTRMRVLRGIQQKKALTVVYGGPGRGKTTLAHHLLQHALVQGDYALRFLSIPHEGCAHGWFLPNVARQYGLNDLAPTVPELIDQVHQRLIQVNEAGKHPVLIVDEAQLFRNASAMEEFRGLLNLLHEGSKVVSMVLFGLEELKEIIKLDPPLAQRVDIRAELKPMDESETQKYVAHRLTNAGGSIDIFTADGLGALWAYTGGIPRLVNSLADNALFDAHLSESKQVDAEIVSAAADSLGLTLDDDWSTPTEVPELESNKVESNSLEAALAVTGADVAASMVSGTNPVAESDNGGAASWVEPAAPMPDSVPRVVAAPSSEPVGRPVDPAILAEATATLEVMAQTTPAAEVSLAPEVELPKADDEFPPLNREFDAPVANPIVAPVEDTAPQAAPEPEPLTCPTLEPETSLSVEMSANVETSPRAELSFEPVTAPSASVPVTPVAEAAPSADVSTPSLEVPAPSAEVSTPSPEVAAPSVEVATPAVAEPAPAPETPALSLTPVAPEPPAPIELCDPDAPTSYDDDTTPSLVLDEPLAAAAMNVPETAPAAPQPVAPQPAAPAASPEPQLKLEAPAPPAPAEVAGDDPTPSSDNDGTFHLGSILDEDNGPPSEPMISAPAPAAAAVSTPSAPTAPSQAAVAAPQAPAAAPTTEPDAVFDLGDLLSDVQDERDDSNASMPFGTAPSAPAAAPQTPAAPPAAAPPAAPSAPAAAVPEAKKPAGPKIELPGEDDDLDSLFDSIQLGD